MKIGGACANRIVWIDYLKIMACFGVFWGHYISSFMVDASGLIGNLLLPIIDGGFWVCCFCIMSGMLVNAERMNVKQFVKSIIKRYFRFVIPLCFCAVLLLLISGVLNALNMGAESEYCNISLFDILKMIFLFDAHLNSPLWTLLPIFEGSIIVYGINLIGEYKIRFIVKLGMIILMVVLQSSIGQSMLYCGGVIIGSMLRDVNDNKNRNRIPCVIMIVGIVFVYIMLAGGHNEIYGYINQIHHLPEAMMLYGYWKMLYATILIICISELYDRFTCFVSQDKVKNFVIKSDFSMGIWLVHWPLIKSFSSYILVDNSMERRELLSVNFVVTNIVVIALGLLFALLMDIIKRYLKKQVIWNAT